MIALDFWNAESVMSIQGNFVLLMQNLDVEAILPYLKQARMVTYTEYEQVSSPHLGLKQKRDKLLLLLTRKGPNHYVHFCWCIVWSGQRALAQKMQIDLSSVPRSIDGEFCTAQLESVWKWHMREHNFYSLTCNNQTDHFNNDF